MSELKHRPVPGNAEIESGSPDPGNSSFFKKLFWSLCLFVLVLMLWLQRYAGVTWDEWMQGQYGKLVLRYFLSGGKDEAFLDFAQTMYLYGGFFDTITGFLYGISSGGLSRFAYSELTDTLRGISTQDIAGSGYYETRHAVNALFGFAAVLFAGLTARLAGSWRTASLTVVFLTLSPRFLAHSLNNPKDIPFACMAAVALYGMLRFFREFPKPKPVSLLAAACGLAGAVNIRIGGLILIAELWALAALYFADAVFIKKQKPEAGRLIAWLSGLTAVSYFCGLIFWPYGLMDPLRHPLEAFAAISNFEGAAGNVLFNGKLILSSGLPWTYLPVWIGLTNPLFFHAGLVLFCFAVFRLRKTFCLPFAMIVFFALFPVIMVILRGSVLYDGWRHFLFVYPPLVILAAHGWDRFFSNLSGKRLAAGCVILFLFAAEPLAWMARNHPHLNVYFNPLAGGLRGAHARFETDYWGNSVRSCAEWLGRYHLRTRPGESALVASNAFFMSYYPYLKKELGPLLIPSVQLSKEEQEKRAPDYTILISRGFDPAVLENSWPPPGSIYAAEADGVALCAVLENPGAAEQ